MLRLKTAANNNTSVRDPGWFSKGTQSPPPHFQTNCRCLSPQRFDNYRAVSLIIFGDAAPASSVKMATQLYWQLRCVREALDCSVTRQSPEHCSSSAWMLHIVRPFIHFGSQSSHSVVTLHYTQHHCSVHLEAILLPIQWRGDLGSTAQNLFGLLWTCVFGHSQISVSASGTNSAQ